MTLRVDLQEVYTINAMREHILVNRHRLYLHPLSAPVQAGLIGRCASCDRHRSGSVRYGSVDVAHPAPGSRHLKRGKVLREGLKGVHMDAGEGSQQRQRRLTSVCANVKGDAKDTALEVMSNVVAPPHAERDVMSLMKIDVRAD